MGSVVTSFWALLRGSNWRLLIFLERIREKRWETWGERERESERGKIMYLGVLRWVKRKVRSLDEEIMIREKEIYLMVNLKIWLYRPNPFKISRSMLCYFWVRISILKNNYHYETDFTCSYMIYFYKWPQFSSQNK